jgi:hypothetical protein
MTGLKELCDRIDQVGYAKVVLERLQSLKGDT